MYMCGRYGCGCVYMAYVRGVCTYIMECWGNNPILLHSVAGN